MSWPRIRRRNKPLDGPMKAYQTFVLDIMASIKDYEQDVARERLKQGLPPLSTAEFLQVASEHLQAQFAQEARR